MQFAISIPQHVPDGAFDPGAMRGYLARAEELGFASAWTQEQVFGTIPHLSPVETLTYAAACTDRIRLGCAVFITSLHSPVHLAKSLSTLDQLSLGRLEVGIGTGGSVQIVQLTSTPDHRDGTWLRGSHWSRASYALRVFSRALVVAAPSDITWITWRNTEGKPPKNPLRIFAIMLTC